MKSRAAGEATPGPWRVDERRADNHVVVLSDLDERTMLVIAHASGRSAGEMVANARLMAAAPLLLEALHQIEDCDDDCHCEHDTPDCCAVVGVFCPRCIAAAAISQA